MDWRESQGEPFRPTHPPIAVNRVHLPIYLHDRMEVIRLHESSDTESHHRRQFVQLCGPRSTERDVRILGAFSYMGDSA